MHSYSECTKTLFAFSYQTDDMDRIDNAIQLVEDEGQNSSTWFYYQALFSNSSDCFHKGEIC